MATAYPVVEGVTFKDIPELAGYCVGADGSVWTCKRFTSHGKGSGFAVCFDGPWKRLNPKPDAHGYVTVNIGTHGISRRRRSVHSIVLEAFVGPRPAGKEACHWNGRRADNRLSNLRWDTRSKNHIDMNRHATSLRGAGNHRAKLTEDDVIAIRSRRLSGITMKALGEQYGVSAGTIHRAIHGDCWGHVKTETRAS